MSQKECSQQCASHTSLPGGPSQAKPATPEIQALADKVSEILDIFLYRQLLVIQLCYDGNSPYNDVITDNSKNHSEVAVSNSLPGFFLHYCVPFQSHPQIVSSSVLEHPKFVLFRDH